LFQNLAESQKFLADRMEELDLFDRRSAHLSHRLYLEVLRTRMRPFGDGVRRFPRMVRDLALSLGKEVRLDIQGENTQVDRDILERLEAPLAHLLRNAVDHGCEPAAERERQGKPAECVIRMEARHSAGMLLVTVTDDGGGVALERLRQSIVQKKLTTPVMAERMTESELLEFLFLPGFTLKDTVTEISGRGVGLDVVQNMVKAVRGAIRLANQPGRGLRVQLQLPLTLSVLRALLVDVAGEPYAFPLSQITRTLKLARDDIQALEGRHHFPFGGQPVGLLSAHQVLDCGAPRPPGNELPVVLLGDRNNRYGLVVDRFLGERELVVQPLDPRLGKVTDISAAALMEDGTPVLIIDVDDLLRSIEKLVEGGRLGRAQRPGLELPARRIKRILAVDDSLTVRELERKLLVNRGYHADVAVDGMDGWNAVRSGQYDLVITDIDMPRIDGIELATLIKKDVRLKSVPVLIVSYKDREEDRMRGLEAGADYYLTKGSFHDETLLQAVVDLIGEPEQ
jgi:two-component system sensor histidine kinase and response regulator WspE